MAQKQKNAQQNSANSRKTSKKKILLWAVLCLILIGGMVYAVRVYQSHRRFSYAEQKKNEIVQKLINSLDDSVASTRVQNECFKAEQTPYFGGTLWCQTATVIKLSKDIDYPTIGKIYLSVGQKYGKTYSNEQDIVQRYIVTLQNGIDCNIKYKDSRGKDYGNIMDSRLQDAIFPALTVACTERAAAKHYPYVD